MNFLAHLHIAEHSDSSLLGNLLGDFVKGDPEKQFSKLVVNGIRLHRWVDSYTDHHPLMSESKALFPDSTRRFSPIALDMLWDHFLAKHWQEFYPLSLNNFVDNAQKQIEYHHALETDLPERYLMVTEKMWQGRWLESYSDLDNIEFALQRMSQRSIRMKPLAECYHSFVKHYSVFSEVFFELYPDVLDKAKVVALK